jgi:hypothetical protein
MVILFTVQNDINFDEIEKAAKADDEVVICWGQKLFVILLYALALAPFFFFNFTADWHKNIILGTKKIMNFAVIS